MKDWRIENPYSKLLRIYPSALRAPPLYRGGVLLQQVYLRSNKFVSEF